MALSADGKRIVSASADKTVKVWDAQTGQAPLTLKGHTDGVNSVAVSADGVLIRVAGGRAQHVTFNGPVDVRRRGHTLVVRVGDVVLEFELER